MRERLVILSRWAYLIVAAGALAGIWAVGGLPAARPVAVAGIACAVAGVVLDGERRRRQRVAIAARLDRERVAIAARLDGELDVVRAEIASLPSALEDLAAAIARLEATTTGLVNRAASLERRSDVLTERFDARVPPLVEAVQRTSGQVRDVVGALRPRIEALEAGARGQAQDVRRLQDVEPRMRSHTTEAVRSLRLVVDDLVDRVGGIDRSPVDATTEASPLLSIAIPGYDRPVELAACLRSLIEQVESGGHDDVEIYVTDDRSPIDEAPRIAHELAEQHAFVGFRANEYNVGLERNLIACLEPCRGEYVLVFGNDDILLPGALDTIMSDLRAGRHDVFLYAKRRIDRSGAELTSDSPGTVPAEVEPGEVVEYDTVLALASQTGLLSAFGFISTLVVRRAPLVAIHPDTYFGLGVYPQLGILLESHGRSSTMFRNVATVAQRTRTSDEKHAEAIGRREESFMVGGAERDQRWFGVPFAALLQRVIERTELTVDDLRPLPERLFGEPSLLEWLARNAAAFRDAGERWDDEVETQADTLLAAVDQASG